MKTTRSVFGLLGLLLLPSIVLAVEDQEPLGANELNKVRAVSQAILKTRGHKRQAVFEETQEIRGEINEIRALLSTAVDALDAPSMQMHQPVQPEPVMLNAGNSKQSKGVSGLGTAAKQKELTGKRKGGQPESALNNKKRVSDLEKARAIVVKSRSRIEDNMLPFWQVWQKDDDKKTRVKRQLDLIEEELATIQAMTGDEQSEKLRALAERLNGRGGPKAEPTPTITSITKHYKK